MTAILKYKAGDTHLVENALCRIGHDYRVTDNKRQLLEVFKVIFPIYEKLLQPCTILR